jgi:two-component system, response regulator
VEQVDFKDIFCVKPKETLTFALFSALLCPEMEATTTKITVPVEDRTLTSKAILLVEDNAQDEELTIRALRKSNIMNNVVVARDGEEALDYLFGRGDHSTRNLELMPALVLLDLKLPKLNGMQVLRALRSNPLTDRVPVVILTSSKEERDIVEGYEVGANSFICKPVDFDKFTEAIGRLGMYWIVLNEPPRHKHK